MTNVSKAIIVAVLIGVPLAIMFGAAPSGLAVSTVTSGTTIILYMATASVHTVLATALYFKLSSENGKVISLGIYVIYMWFILEAYTNLFGDAGLLLMPVIAFVGLTIVLAVVLIGVTSLKRRFATKT